MQPGLNWIGVILPVGKIMSDQVRELARIAQECGDGQIRMTVWQNFLFSGVPDVPVTKFVLTMKGGKRGLLTNTQALCGRQFFSKSTLRAQNGKKVRSKRLKLKVPACGKGKGKKSR